MNVQIIPVFLKLDATTLLLIVMMMMLALMILVVQIGVVLMDLSFVMIATNVLMTIVILKRVVQLLKSSVIPMITV
jgi:hypothetical protein